MPSFKYRLKPLLEQRQRALDAAEETVVERQKELRQAELQKELLESEQRRVAQKLLDGRRTLFHPTDGRPLTSDELMRRRLFLVTLAEELERLKDAIFSQQLAIADAAERLDESRSHESECRRAVEIMEKHRTKLEKRFRAEIEQKEALEQDELGNVMYLMKRSQQ